MAPALEIEVGQRWTASRAEGEWVEIAGPIAGDSWAVISSHGEIGTIRTAKLLDEYALTT